MRSGFFRYNHNISSWTRILTGILMILLTDLIYANLTSISVTMGDQKAGISNIHTIQFTTSLSIPVDGKIVIVYPSDFNLNGVSIASSSTIDGTMMVVASGDSVIISRNGDGSSETGGETESIHLANIRNSETAGNYTLVVRTKNFDNSKIESGISNSFIITHDVLSRFAVVKSGGNETAGNPFGNTITAQDAYNNTVTNYTGTVSLSDITGTISPNTTTSFTSGVWTGNVTITKAYSGNTITATGNGRAGSSNSFNVIAGNVDYFEIDGIISPQTAGTDFNIDMTAYDEFGNVAEGFNDTVNLSELSGKVAITPPISNSFSNGLLNSQSATITEVEQDLKIRVNDGFGHSGISGYFNVIAAQIDHFTISNIATQNAGQPFLITIQALDLYNNVATSFNGSGNQVTISLVSTGTVSPLISGDFSQGLWSGNATITQTHAGEQIVVNDGSGHMGSSNAFDVVSSDVDHFVFNSIGNQTVGLGFTVDITAQDANNNTVTSFNGTVNLIDETGTATPQQVTFSGGTCSENIIITKSLSSNSLTVTGVGKSGSSNMFVVNPGGVDHFEIDEIVSPQIAGTDFSIHIQAMDGYGNVATGFGGTVEIDDATGTIGPSVSQNFSSGTVTETVVITSGDSDIHISVNDGSGHHGTSNLFNVIHGPLHHFIIPVIADQATGQPFSVQVFALDVNNNLVINFSGAGNTADISHTGTGSISPMVTDEFISGIWVGNITIQQTQNNDQLQFARTGGGATGISNGFKVTPSSIDHFVISTIGGIQTAGSSFLVTITAEDANNNLVTSFSGTANLSDETGTNSPKQINFVNGIWSGNVFITKTANNNSLTITGVGKVGTSNLFQVNPASMDSFEIGVIGSPQIAGQDFQITITARDNFGNTATGFNGTITLSDETGTLSPTTSGVFYNGVRNQTVRIEKMQKDVRITGTYNGFSGKSNPFNIESGGLHHFSIGPVGDQMAGVPFTIQVNAEDRYNNIATSFVGTINIEDLSGTITPSTSANFVSGQWTRGVTVNYAIHNDRITVTRTGGYESGESNLFEVFNPPGVRILNFIPSENQVIVGQYEDWTMTMVVQNQAGSNALLDSVHFLFSRNNIPQNDYLLNLPSGFENSGSYIIAGNAIDTLITTVDRTGLGIGNIHVKGTIYCTDMSTGLAMEHYRDLDIEVQDSARLEILKILTSQSEVTRGQTENWKVTMVLSNPGGSDVLIDSSKSITNIFFSTGTDWKIRHPSTLQGGAWSLSGGEIDTLAFIIEESSSGSLGNYTIRGSIAGREVGTDRLLTDQTSIGQEAVITLENPPSLNIVNVQNLAPNAPYVNITQDFKINVTLENSGGDAVNEIELSLNSDGASSIVPVKRDIEQLKGGVTHLVDFSIGAFSTPTGPAGETFYALVSGYADNTHLLIEKGGSHDTTLAVIQVPASLQVVSIKASEDTVWEGQGDPWTVKVTIQNTGGATLVLNPPQSEDLSFHFNGITLSNYSVVAPASLVLRGDLKLPGGAIDTLVYEIKYTGGGGGSGTTEIKVTIQGQDNNDKSVLMDSNTLPIVVIPDPNLRILKTKIRTVNMKGLEDGYVNTGQSLEVVAIVENGLGKTVQNIKVLLYTKGQSEILDAMEEISIITSTSRLDSVIFPVRADTVETLNGETLVATITQAKVEGTDYPPGASVDSTALVIIQKPAELSIQLDSKPADGVVTKNQEFTLTAYLENHGTAGIDDSGLIRLLLPDDDYQLVSDNEDEFIQLGEEVTWTIRAPNHAKEVEYISVKLITVPNDQNTGNPATMKDDMDFNRIQIITIDHHLSATLSIVKPDGAIDGIVSTKQDFEVKTVLTWSNVDKISAVIEYPLTYQTTADTQTVPDSEGNRFSLTWKIRAPDLVIPSDNIVVRAWGVDSLDHNEIITAIPTIISIETVGRADLTMNLEIVNPPDAVDGIVSLGQSFVIMTTLTNQGDALIEGDGEVELNPLPQGYGTIEKYKKVLDFGGTATWSITAPSESTGETVNIGVTIKTVPHDVNTDDQAYVSQPSATVGITTQGAWLSVHSLPPGGNSTIVPGQSWIKMMVLEFDNRGEETSGSIFIDTLKFVVEDLNNELLSPNSVLSQFVVTDNQDTTMIYGSMTSISSSSPLIMDLDPPPEVTTNEKMRMAIFVFIKEEVTTNYFRLNLTSEQSIVARNASYQSIPVRDPTQEEWKDIRSDPKKIFQRESEPILFNCPNPFGKNGEQETTITYFLEENNQIEFKIHTLFGELVWSKTIDSSDPLTQAGKSHSIIWDGLNDRGFMVINGVYILYLITDKGVLAKTKIGVFR